MALDPTRLYARLNVTAANLVVVRPSAASGRASTCSRWRAGWVSRLGHILRNIVAQQRMPTLQFPDDQRTLPPRFRGRHRSRRRPMGRRAASLHDVSDRLPADCTTSRRRRARTRTSRNPGALRDRSHALHLLRLLRRGVPEGCHPPWDTGIFTDLAATRREDFVITMTGAERLNASRRAAAAVPRGWAWRIALLHLRRRCRPGQHLDGDAPQPAVKRLVPRRSVPLAGSPLRGVACPPAFRDPALGVPGAVMVLVLFVIMLLNLRQEEARPQPLGAGRFTIGTLVVLGVAWKTLSVLWRTEADRAPVDASFGTVAGVSEVLFTRWILQFEIVSILLLAVIVAVVVLVKRSSRSAAPKGLS